MRFLDSIEPLPAPSPVVLVAERPVEPVVAPPVEPAEPASTSTTVRRPAAPLPVPGPSNAGGHCTRCQHEQFVDRTFHGGQSMARECGRCGRLLGFIRWYGQPGDVDPAYWAPGPGARFDPWWLDDPELQPAEQDRGPQLPTVPAEPCRTCGGPFFWEDVARELHCCQCVAIPLRTMANGGAWRVCYSPDGNWWEDWSPEHWDPFAHLAAIEQQQWEQERGGF